MIKIVKVIKGHTEYVVMIMNGKATVIHRKSLNTAGKSSYMNGSCVMDEHSDCPDSKRDNYECSCPCHLGN